MMYISLCLIFFQKKLLIFKDCAMLSVTQTRRRKVVNNKL